MNVVITGARGFIGRNLLARLGQDSGHALFAFDRDDPPAQLYAALADADLVIHLAGINRPQTVDEFRTGNVDLTAEICRRLLAAGRGAASCSPHPSRLPLTIPMVSASGRQRTLCATMLLAAARWPSSIVSRTCLVSGVGQTTTQLLLPFVIALLRDQAIAISDPMRELDLVYIDDVVDELRQIWWPSSLLGLPIKRCQPRIRPRSAR